MSTYPVARPGSVTVVVVLVWISAILTIIGGVLVLLVSPVEEARAGREVLVLLGIVTLIVGLITAAVASRLGKGGNGARMIVSILEVLQIAAAIAVLLTGHGPGTATQAVINILLAAAILVLLWNRRANAFFAAN